MSKLPKTGKPTPSFPSKVSHLLWVHVWVVLLELDLAAIGALHRSMPTQPNGRALQQFPPLETHSLMIMIKVY